MLEIFLIRHGKTYGNTLGRYIGTTDEPLCAEGRERLTAGIYPQVDAVYASPMKRCLETAAVLYPGLTPETVEELRECDFGEFENKNYLELSGNPSYQEWVDSGGTLPFPGGESQEDFKRRCREGFRKVLERELLYPRMREGQRMRESQKMEEGWRMGEGAGKIPAEGWTQEASPRRIALVVHGGTIMSILEAYGNPREPFYHWQAKNGEGFRARLDLEACFKSPREAQSNGLFTKGYPESLMETCQDTGSVRINEKREEVRLYEVHALRPFAGVSA